MTDAPINTLLSFLVDKYGTLYPFLTTANNIQFSSKILQLAFILIVPQMVVKGWFCSLASRL